MIKDGLIESIINKRGDFDKDTISLVKQYMIIDILSDLGDGIFNKFGEILSYKLNESLLNEDIKFDVRNYCYNMKLQYVVLKKEDSIYVLDVEQEKEDYFGIKTSGTIAYIYKNIMYMDRCIKDDLFYSELKRNNFELGNVVQYSFTKDIYKEIAAFYDNIKKEDFFKERVKEFALKKDTCSLSKTKPQLIKEFIQFFTKDDFSFSLKDADMDMYFNIFKGDGKDKIISQLLNRLHKKDYKEYTRNLHEYILRGSEYIRSIIEDNKEFLTRVLVNKHSKIYLEKNCIEESFDILNNYESLCIYNREVIYLYELIKNTIDSIGCKKINLSFNGKDFINISGAIRCDKSIVNIEDIDFQSIDIFTNIWSQKTNLIKLVSLNDIKEFVIHYKGEEIFNMNENLLNELRKIRDNICLKDIIN